MTSSKLEHITKDLIRNKMSPTQTNGERQVQADVPQNVAIIFGVTGLVGRELARTLTSKPDWLVHGVARKPEIKPVHSPNYHFTQCDLLNQEETQEKLLSLLKGNVTHIFWVTWATHFPLNTRECYEQNKVMLSNALNSVLPAAPKLKHFSLQTGMHHYVSLDNLADEKVWVFDEEAPRASNGCNFYYALEDLLSEKLRDVHVGWAVHRPGLLIGSSCRTLYNFMGSLCVYAAICKRLNLPFVFGGMRQCWEENYIDGSDARLVAEQHIWEATAIEARSSAQGEAFNAVNGAGFTWQKVWPDIGKKLGLEVGEAVLSEDFRFTKEMGDKGRVWEEIVEKERLVKTNMADLANWDFLDTLFRYPGKLLGSREKADRLGFRIRYKTLDSIFYWIDFMRDERLIP